jgi:hypothetical protein
VTLTYKVLINNYGRFELGYVVRDCKGMVVYYNLTVGADLTGLIRQSVQEIWGNHKAYGDQGEFFLGISYLIQGRKIPVCKKENRVPDILPEGACLKEFNGALLTAEVSEMALSGLTSILGNVMPWVLLIYIFVFAYQMLARSFGPNADGGDSGPMFMVGLVVLIAATIGNYWLTRKISRKAFDINLTKRFI